MAEKKNLQRIKRSLMLKRKLQKPENAASVSQGENVQSLPEIRPMNSRGQQSLSDMPELSRKASRERSLEAFETNRQKDIDSQ